MEASAPEATGPPTTPTRQRRIVTLTIIGVTGAIILAIAVLTDQSAGAVTGATSVALTGETSGVAPAIGMPAPDLQAVTVDGRSVRLGDFVGRPVWLTFGASWCQACRAENADIQTAFEQRKSQGVVVLAVFIAEDATTVRDYANRVGLTYLQVADPDTRIASAYRVLGIPSHYFIDRSGALRLMQIGTLEPARIAAALDEIQR